MKTWIRLTKSFRNGTLVDYKYIDMDEIDTDYKQEELCEQWGESTDGGHSYGYTVNLDILKENEYPPKEWLEREIKSSKSRIKRIRNEKVITKKERIKNEQDNIAALVAIFLC